MRYSLFSLALLAIAVNSQAQVSNAGNGLNLNSNTVQLGGTLSQSTSIDLGSGYDLIFHKSGQKYFSILNNGNIGIGNGTPAARLSFPDTDQSDDPIGISWYNGSPTSYGIHRTAGPWAAPNYQQLRLGWHTGIILDPGNAYGKSYVDIQGDGLRVTSGNVGIGTATPGQKLSIQSAGGNAVDMALRNSDGTSLLSLATDGAALSSISSYYGLTFNAQNSPFFSFKIGGSEFFKIDQAGITHVNGGLRINSGAETGTIGIGSSALEFSKVGRVQLGYDFHTFTDNVFIRNLTGNDIYGIFSSNTGVPRLRIKQINGKTDDLIQLIDASDNKLFTVTNAGNVGIGTSSPQYILDVDGDVRLGHQENAVILFPGNVSGIVKKSGESSFWGLVQNPNSIFSVKKQNIGGTILYGTSDFTELFRVNNDGNVGVGITNPTQKLEVMGNIKANGFVMPTAAGAGKVLTSDASGNATWQMATGGGSVLDWTLGGNNFGTTGSIGNADNQPLKIITNNQGRIYISASGNVGIGTENVTDAAYKLSVEGTIRTRKVRVDPATWADYVFDNDYHLRPIKELEQYIQAQKHLPDVPTTEEVKQKGIDLGDNQVVLLKKIEELTLYVIEQHKKQEIQSLQSQDMNRRLQELDQQVKKLTQENERLKKKVK